MSILDKTWLPQRMTKRELLRFARGLASDELLVDRLVVPFEDVAKVFPLGCVHDMSQEARNLIGACYEWRRRAVGHLRDGKPVFQSVKFIHREDWLHARDLVAARWVAT